MILSSCLVGWVGCAISRCCNELPCVGRTKTPVGAPTHMENCGNPTLKLGRAGRYDRGHRARECPRLQSSPKSDVPLILWPFRENGSWSCRTCRGDATVRRSVQQHFLSTNALEKLRESNSEPCACHGLRPLASCTPASMVAIKSRIHRPVILGSCLVGWAVHPHVHCATHLIVALGGYHK